MKSFRYFLGEGIPEDRLTTITVKCVDLDRSLERLLEYIKKNGNGGHSFSIIVDPDSKDRTERFGWDGDGSDCIADIKVEKPKKTL